MAEVRNPRGRAYQCVRCDQVGVTYLNEKRRMVSHIMKVHLSLDQVPCYCRVCHFRCQGEADLQAHVTTYPEHGRKVLQLQVEGRLMPVSEMLLINEDPYLIGESDMRRYTREASDEFFAKKRGTRQTTPKEEDIIQQAVNAAGLRTVDDILPELLSFGPEIEEHPTAIDAALAPLVTEPDCVSDSQDSGSSGSSSADDCCSQLAPVMGAINTTLGQTSDLLKWSEKATKRSIDALTEAVKQQTASFIEMTAAIREVTTELKAGRTANRSSAILKENVPQRSHSSSRREEIPPKRQRSNDRHELPAIPFKRHRNN